MACHVRVSLPFPIAAALRWLIGGGLRACVLVLQLAAVSSLTSQQSGEFWQGGLTSQGPFRMEGKVIHSRAQALLPTGLLWWGEGVANLVSVQGLVTQGTARTLLFALAWDLLVAAQSLLSDWQRINVSSECRPNTLSVTPSWLWKKQDLKSALISHLYLYPKYYTLIRVSKSRKADCHLHISEDHCWCVGKWVISPNCIVACVRERDRPGVL